MKVNIGQPDECWEWQGYIGTHGYGMVKRGGPPTTAHRHVWRLAYGLIPGELFVLHRCDNRSCVNPLHLFLGTNQDNMDDMNAKHRGAFGERHGNAKLTAQDVREIRQLNLPQAVLAHRYGTSQPNISEIRAGKKWTSVK